MNQKTKFAIAFVAGILFGALLVYIAQKNPEQKVAGECAERDVAALSLPKELPKNLVPEFKDPGVLKSNVDGRVYVRWTKVEAATRYEITVHDASGIEIQKFRTVNTATMIKDLVSDPKLKETQYVIRVRALLAGDAPGKVSEPKTVAMLPLKNLTPPSIKSITTGD